MRVCRVLRRPEVEVYIYVLTVAYMRVVRMHTDGFSRRDRGRVVCAKVVSCHSAFSRSRVECAARREPLRVLRGGR